jgi:hypothetical protein
MEGLMPHTTNIQVFVRFRPMSLKEKSSHEVPVWKVTNDSVSINPDSVPLFQDTKKQYSSKTYNFSKL